MSKEKDIAVKVKQIFDLETEAEKLEVQKRDIKKRIRNAKAELKHLLYV